MQRGVKRRYVRTHHPADGDIYREMIERSPSLSEEVPELDQARTADEQIRLYEQSNERIVREGRA